MIAKDATIARLRAKLKDRELTKEETGKVLLILIAWYKDQLENEKSTPREKDISE